MDLGSDSAEAAASPSTQEGQQVKGGAEEPVPPLLPEYVLFEIFKHLELDALTNCRLVNSTWNNSIINSSVLMRKFRFYLNDSNVEDFLDSSISFKVKKVTLSQSIYTKDLFGSVFRQIGSTVESLTLDFDLVSSSSDEVYIVSLLISNCCNLKNLVLLSFDCYCLRELTKSEVQHFGRHIRILTVQLVEIEIAHPGIFYFGTFILNLPNLENIILQGNQELLFRDSIFSDFFCCHMEKYPGHLRCIDFEDGLDFDTFTKCKYRLLASAGRFNVLLKRYSFVDINEFIRDLQDYEDLPITKQNCSSIRKALFTFFTNEVENQSSKLGLCTKLNTLYLNFEDCPRTGQLAFVENLENLKVLYLDDYGKNANAEAGYIDTGHFYTGIPSLEFLSIRCELFEPHSFHSMQSVFPNLCNLELHYLDRLPNDLFFGLSKLDKLKLLSITNSKLTDEMCTMQCEVNWNDQEVKMVPAIVSFKCLKSLEIGHCKELTDLTLINGLALSQTLDKIVLYFSNNNDKITQQGFSAIIESGRMLFHELLYNGAIFVTNELYLNEDYMETVEADLRDVY